MKIRVYDIKLNNRSFTQPDVFHLFVPTAEHDDAMLGWLQEYSNEPYTKDHALITYIRTAIFYGSTKLDYKLQILIGKHADDEEAIGTDQPFCPDMFDHPYTTYNNITFDLALPESVVIDENSLLFADYNEELDQVVFEALLNGLKFTVRNIVR